ncbi:MAG TPA: ABC transporter permease subunit [Beutenbergiaceae bacterium]|nr:ABC transporter permease subunit [Beutenbergiaceae bacterium]
MDTLSNIWNWEFAAEVLPELLETFVRVTLLVTVLGSLIAAALGLIWAIILWSTPAAIEKPFGFVLDFIRMTPLPMHLLLVFYITDWSLITIGIVVIGIHYSTYMSESYRAGIRAVPKGQWEATTALSLPIGRTWRDVVLPQALRATVPSLANWAIAMFKDTPFLIIISVPEMVTVARQFGGRNFAYTEAFTIAGLIFLAASYPIAVLTRKLEKRLAY